MNNLLIDTNIIIDLLAKRQPFYDDAAALFSLADNKEVILAISSLTFANTSYILSKMLPPKQTKDILMNFRSLVRILSLDDKVIDLALGDDYFKDFEDGLQYYTAVENQMDLIISRNKKHFNSAQIPVLTAKEFLS